MLASLTELARFTIPIRFVVRRLLPRLRREVAKVGLFAITGAALNAGGFLLLLPVLNALAHGEESLEVGAIKLSAGPQELAALLLVALALVVCGLYLRYRIHTASLKVQRLATHEAALIGLTQVRRFAAELDTRRAASRVTGKMASGCGFVMCHFSVGLADALQLTIFVAAMIWLSPGLSLALLVPGLIILFLFARAVTGLTVAVAARGEKNRGLREELDELADLLASDTVSDDELRARMTGLHRDGAHGASLDGHLDVRREIRRGPIIVEALFPLALVPLALLALATDDWQQHAGILVVFVLLLRTVIALSQKLAGLLMVMGRFHPEISDFMGLHSAVVPLSFHGTHGDEDEEEFL